jgi:hypothetical protein
MEASKLKILKYDSQNPYKLTGPLMRCKELEVHTLTDMLNTNPYQRGKLGYMEKCYYKYCLILLQPVL